MTFLEKVDAFWQWFLQNESALSQMTEHPRDYDPQEIIAFVDEGVSLISPELQYTIGGKREFTFSAGGKEYLFYLLPYLISRKPEALSHWNFHPFLPGCHGAPFDFSMFGVSLSSNEVLVDLGFEPSSNLFHLSFYHPQLCALDQPSCLAAFYQLLDLSIGESASHIYINGITPLEQPQEGLFPLTDLQSHLQAAIEDLGIPLLQRPDEQSVAYGFHPRESSLPRFDVIEGSICYTGLLNEYYAGQTENLNGISEYGASAGFLTFDLEEYLDTDEAGSIRYQLEQQIQDTLGPRGSGQEMGIVLGGATGMEHCYIDLLLYHPPALNALLRPLLVPYSFNFSFSDFRLLAPTVPLALSSRLS